MRKINVNIKELSGNIWSYARQSGTAINKKVNSGRFTKNIKDLILGKPLPYLTRHLIYLKDDGPIVIGYYYTFSRKVVIKSVRTLIMSAGQRFPQPLKQADVILDWKRYLSKRIDIANLKKIEICGAIPYQLSTISPFDPENLCFCVRSLEKSMENSFELCLDYSHIQEVSSKLDGLTNILY
ncbi:MAG: hypothetical protein SVO01_11085, partial [Thermotogota bacterium]|nr:hypothetical protein [Thermotogota bacterium]